MRGGGRAHGALRGFTMIELIVTMMVIGIMAVVVLPRFADRSSFDARGARDGLVSVLRYAQKAAIAQRRYVCVTTGATTTLTYEATYASSGTISCGGNLLLPSGDINCSGAAVGNRLCTTVTVQAKTIYFSPLGRPADSLRAAASSTTITVDGASDITVEKETGYVR